MKDLSWNQNHLPLSQSIAVMFLGYERFYYFWHIAYLIFFKNQKKKILLKYEFGSTGSIQNLKELRKAEDLVQFSDIHNSQFLNFDVLYRHISEVLDKTFWKDEHTHLQRLDQVIACKYM